MTSQPGRARYGIARRRFRTDADVERQARLWAAAWVKGASISQWIRHHVSEIIGLSQQECWSWQDLAEAMNQAGIRYGTNRPWSADLLSNKVARARRELRTVPAKARRGSDVFLPADQKPVSGGEPPSSASAPPLPMFDPDEEFAPVEKEPEFKIASLRGWTKPSTPMASHAMPGHVPRTASPMNAPEIDVDAVLREFLARPRYGAIPMPQPLEPEDD